MKKNIYAYYSLLAIVVVFQLLWTVLSLSQNIGFGQKIASLEEKQRQLQEEKMQNEKALSEQLALQKVESASGEYENISDVLLVEQSSSNLASR